MSKHIGYDKKLERLAEERKPLDSADPYLQRKGERPAALEEKRETPKRKRERAEGQLVRVVKVGPARGIFRGKRQNNAKTVTKLALPIMVGKAVTDVVDSFRPLIPSVQADFALPAFRIIASTPLRSMRKSYPGKWFKCPNMFTPYSIALMLVYFFSSQAPTLLQRAYEARSQLADYIDKYVPVNRNEANAIGFEDCWLDGLLYPEKMVRYTTIQKDINVKYIDFLSKLKPHIHPGFLPPGRRIPPDLYDERVIPELKRVRGGNKINMRKLENSRDRRRVRRALNGSNGEATNSDDVNGEDNTTWVPPALKWLKDAIDKAEARFFKGGRTSLMQEWTKKVAQLMLMRGTEDVEDVIYCCDYDCDTRVLAICPQCRDLHYSETGVLEHEVDDYNSLWTQHWYVGYCAMCLGPDELGAPVRCTTLNGANGEATNKDDVKGRRSQQKKKKNDARKKQVVVVQTRSLRSSGRKITNRPRVFSMDLKRYMLALTNPFHPEAVGAKCSVYAYRNAVPYTIRWKAIIQTQQSEGCDIILQPNPAFYGWCSYNGAFVAVRSILGPLTVVTPTKAYGLTGALVDRDEFNTPSIATTLSSFRVVGGGIKVKSIFTSAQGQTISTIVPILMQNSDLSYRDVTGGAPPQSAQYTNTVAGNGRPGGIVTTFVQEVMTGNSFTTSSILTVPDTKEFTTYDLLSNTLCAVFKPVTPEAFEFKDCGTENPQMVNNAVNTVGPTDINDWDYGAGTAVNSSRRGTTDSAGWSGLYISSTPSINSASPAQTYELDYIIHCEGYPRIQGISGQVSTGPVQSESVVLNAVKRMKQITIDAISTHGPNMAKQAMNVAVQNLMRQTGAMPRIEF